MNLTETLGLREASRVVFSRIRDGEYQAVRILDGDEDVSAFIETFDSQIRIRDEELCETAFRLQFAIGDRTETFDFFCAKDRLRIGGEHSFWGGWQGSAPGALLDLIAPYLAAEPLPGIPSE